MKGPPSCSCQTGVGNFLQVDRRAFEHVVEQRTAIDRARLEARRCLHVRAPPQHEIELGAVRREPQGDIDARHRGEDVGKHPGAFREPGNLVEHHGGVSHAPLIDIDYPADLLLGLGSGDKLELAGGFNTSNPIPEILVRHDCFLLVVLSTVMRGLDPGLDPRIHVCAALMTWMAGTSPAMTTGIALIRRH